MSMDFPLERDAFNAFMDQRFVGAGSPVEATLEDALAAFRAYQRDVDRLRAKLKPAIEQADRGEGRPLDIEAVIQRLRDRVAQHEAGQ